MRSNSYTLNPESFVPSTTRHSNREKDLRHPALVSALRRFVRGSSRCAGFKASVDADRLMKPEVQLGRPPEEPRGGLRGS